MLGNSTIIYIYALRDPQTQSIRYIGSTHNLAQRLYAHRRSPQASVKHWVEALHTAALEPIMEVLEQTTNDDRVTRECYWIRQFVPNGTLLNIISPVPHTRTGPEKTTMACRLTPEALALLATLAKRYGLNNSDMLEIMIRERARTEGLWPPAPDATR